jgi:hypothetical protein
VFAKEQTEIF